MRPWIFYLLLWPVLTCAAETKPVDLTSQLDLAAKLLQEGHTAGALGILLSQPSPQGDKEKAVKLRRRYHTLTGLAYLKLEQYPKALEHLEQAALSGPAEPVLYVYLAQGYYRLQRYQEVLKALERAASLLDQYPALYEIKAQSHLKLHQEDAAWQTLIQAQRKFPNETNFLRRQVFYLLEKKLYHQAAELGLKYLNAGQGSAQDYAAIGNALRLGGVFSLASTVLEQGHLRYPQDPTLAKLLAHVYLSRQMPQAAAWILEQAARFDPNLYSDAAECYRRAGDYTRALWVNALILEVKTQRRQRVALLLALQRYDEVLVMHQPLARAGLLEEDAVRYALAYAAYRAGKLNLVEPYLNAISDPQIFRQAAELRRRLKECEDQPWRCA